MAQSQPEFNPDGSVRTWEYSPDVAHTQLCMLIARLDLPLCIGETDAFEEYVATAHNPRFCRISRQTTTRDFARYFNDRRRVQLVESLKSVSSIALTSDIWSDNGKENYLSVVAHYMNVDWHLEKKIDLRLIDVSHNAKNIAERITSVLANFGLSDKILCYIGQCCY
jgi:hypothetical protein